MWKRNKPEPVLTPGQVALERVAYEQWYATQALVCISDMERLSNGSTPGDGQLDQIRAVYRTWRQAIADHPVPSEPMRRLRFALECLTAVGAILDDGSPGDPVADIYFYIRQDWAKSRGEEVPPWIPRPASETQA
jgi:hypothetical protein